MAISNRSNPLTNVSNAGVSVNLADVRKVVLEENLTLNDPALKQIRERLFGNSEMNWVEFHHVRDFAVNPTSAVLPINFFMFPRAEVAVVPRDELDAKAIAYQF